MNGYEIAGENRRLALRASYREAFGIVLSHFTAFATGRHGTPFPGYLVVCELAFDRVSIDKALSDC
jgi:hypothetical protein